MKKLLKFLAVMLLPGGLLLGLYFLFDGDKDVEQGTKNFFDLQRFVQKTNR